MHTEAGAVTHRIEIITQGISEEGILSPVSLDSGILLPHESKLLTGIKGEYVD